MVAHAATYKFSVEEYDRLAEIGFFREEARVELIEGEIVWMPPVGNRHLGAVNRLNRLFAPLWAGDRAVVSVQNPLICGPESEPEPDVTLLKFAPHLYGSRKPSADDVLLLVEVADSSLDYDRLTKLTLYARYVVPEVWLVNLQEDRFEVYRGASGTGYLEAASFQRGQSFAPLAFPDLTVRVEDIIG